MKTREAVDERLAALGEQQAALDGEMAELGRLAEYLQSQLRQVAERMDRVKAQADATTGARETLEWVLRLGGDEDGKEEAGHADG